MKQDEGNYGIPLSYECLYKNLKSLTEEPRHLPRPMINAACTLNLPLYQTHFYSHTLTTTLLLPDNVPRFRCLMKQKYGFKLVPIITTMSYRQVSFIDYSNIFQRGNTAIIHLSGKDKQKCLKVSDSLEEFMHDQYTKFTNSYYYKCPKNQIHSFPADVKNEQGSVTITRVIDKFSVKVEACA